MKILIPVAVCMSFVHLCAFGANNEHGTDNGNKAEDKLISRQCEESLHHLQSCVRDLEARASKLSVEANNGQSENDNEGPNPGVGGFHAGTHGALAAVSAGQASVEHQYGVCVQIADGALNRCRADLNAGKNVQHALNNISDAKLSMSANLERARSMVRTFQSNLSNIEAASKAQEKSPGELGSLGVP